MSSYRPNYNALPLPPPPPPPPAQNMPPLPLGPPPSYDPYRRGESWRSRPPQSSHYSPPQSDFSFRNQDSAPQYPRGQDTSTPPNSLQSNKNNRPPTGSSYQDRRNINGPRRGGRSFRGRGPKVLPSDRPLLQHRGGGDGDEQMLGVTVGTQKFIPVEDISDSEGEDMDESNSDREQDEKQNPRENDAGQEPPTKRRATAFDGTADGDSEPKWSNPDPYSVLPPVDDVYRKRKDPVAFIRKGFKPAEEKATEQNQVAANDDFISFDDGSAASSPPSEPESRASPERIILDVGNDAHDTDPAIDDDPYLGSRKRTYDDEIKQRPQQTSRSNPSGSLLSEWIPRIKSEATPWLDRETASIRRAGFRLHREICDWFNFVKPQQHEQAVRQGLLSRLQALIRRELSDCTVHCFGSFAAGLHLPNADMDIVINSHGFISTGHPLVCQTKSKIFRFGKFIRNSRIAQEGSVDVVASAKVPIIKFVDRITGIKVDISFENITGLAANDTVGAWKRQYPAMPVIVAIIKQFLMMRGLNEVQFGGLGGFSVTCLVVSLLQNMPRVQNRSLIPEQNLGEILIEFLDFYGNRIDLSRTGIVMNPPGYFDKQAMNRSNFGGPVYNGDKVHRLAIIDPNREGNDISGGSKKVGLIFDRFARAHAELMDAMRARSRPSLLDWLLGERESLSRPHATTLPRNQPLSELQVPRRANQQKPGQALSTKTDLEPASKPSDRPHVQSGAFWAALLKEDSPDIEVPDSITKVERNTLIDHYKAHHATMASNHSSPIRALDSALALPRHSLCTSQQLQEMKGRAHTLKERFPGMPEIPDILTKKGYSDFTAKFNRNGVQPVNIGHIAHHDTVNPNFMGKRSSDVPVLDEATIAQDEIMAPLSRRSARLATQAPWPPVPALVQGTCPTRQFYEHHNVPLIEPPISWVPPLGEAGLQVPSAKKRSFSGDCPDRMASPTDERRQEVTRNFTGMTTGDPVKLD